MEKPRLTRPWLESLSTTELLGVAASWALDVPEGLERAFLIEELLDMAREEEGTDASRPLTLGPEIPEPAPLPRQYNITGIDVLVRDPLWVFAFWEIRAQERESLERSPDFGGYCLRVFAVPDGEMAAPRGGGETAAFVVNVGAEDTSWYLGFPPEENRGGQSRYRVELCANPGREETVLAWSGAFRLPPCLPSVPSGPQKSGREYRLYALSGLEELPVLRNTESGFFCPAAGALSSANASAGTVRAGVDQDSP